MSAEVMAPFSDRAGWTQNQKRPMELAIKDGLDLHFLLMVQHDHSQGVDCPCPLATALRKALRGGV